MSSPTKLDIDVPLRLKLSVTDGPCEGQVYDSTSLNRCHLTVGRVKKAHIYLKDSSVSEKHAEIMWDGAAGTWLLKDTRSSNGTRVNGAPLKPFQPYKLKSGDYIAFGATTILTVELEEQTLADLTVESLLRAHFETFCQELEAAGTLAAEEIIKKCQLEIDDLLNSTQATAA